MENSTKELINDISRNYSNAKKCLNSGRPYEGVQFIRAALECAVTLYWQQKQLGNIPMKNGEIDLSAAIADYKFAKNFSYLIKGDMQGIRLVAANAKAEISEVSADEAADMLSRLENCLKIMSDQLGISLLEDNNNNTTAAAPAVTSDKNIEHKKATQPAPIEEEKIMTETEKFWEAFKELLIENGEPYTLTIDGNCAIIRKNKYAELKITFDPTQKYFVFGLCTANKALWDILNSHKAEISSQLSQKPVWGSTATTFYVQNKSDSAFYKNLPYTQLIEDMLPDTEVYLDILNKYSTTEDKAMLPPIVSNQPAFPKPLIANLGHGLNSRAQTIYDAGCNTFGWDSRKRGNFSMMKLLYTTDATPEGYSVWCLCNIAQKVISNDRISWINVNSIFNKGKNWANILLADGSLIYEIWKDIGPAFPGYRDDMTKRVTFLKYKDTNGDYVFAGIYEPIRIEDKVINGKVYHLKVYERVADTYGE